MVALETDRLIIRDHRESDLENHHRLMSDETVMSYIKDIKTNSLKESKDNLEFSIRESESGNRKCYFFAIEDKVSLDFIGSIGFTVMEKNENGGTAEIGYFILKEHWGKGYVTEAAKSVLDYAFNVLMLHKVYSGCNIENKESENIMIKIGMEKEGHLYKHILHNGKWKDRVIYAKLKNNENIYK